MTHWIDRSRMEDDKICQRSRFWRYDYEGRGLVPVGGNSNSDTIFGTAIHGLLERPSKELPLPGVGELTPDGHSTFDEWNALAVGLGKVYNTFLVPRIDEEYEWIASELELQTELAPGIVLMSRLDGVLRRKADGLYFVLEAKTSDGRYINDLKKGASRNFQLLLETEALRRFLNDPKHYGDGVEGDRQVGGAVLLVFNKGVKQSVSPAEKARGLEGHRRLGPFTYCYSKEFASGERKYRLDYASGWDRTPTWTIPGWLDFVFEHFPNECQDQVELVTAVDTDPIRTQSVIHQVMAREYAVSSARDLVIFPPDHWESDVDTYYSQNFAACSNYGGFRRSCAYEQLCFSPRAASEPLESGYEWRVANHPQEGASNNSGGTNE